MRSPARLPVGRGGCRAKFRLDIVLDEGDGARGIGRAVPQGAPDIEPVDQRGDGLGGLVGVGARQQAGQPAHQVGMKPARIDRAADASARRDFCAST